jgi:hypothetical protein
LRARKCGGRLEAGGLFPIDHSLVVDKAGIAAEDHKAALRPLPAGIVVDIVGGAVGDEKRDMRCGAGSAKAWLVNVKTDAAAYGVKPRSFSSLSLLASGPRDGKSIALARVGKTVPLPKAL